jgi:hypothetical protein
MFFGLTKKGGLSAPRLIPINLNDYYHQGILGIDLHLLAYSGPH